MSKTDQQLIREYCSGKPGSFNLLVERWQSRIHALAFRYFNCSEEAAEITQKTFIKAYRKLHTLNDPTAFSAWIYRIAHNLCRDETKRAGRRRSTSLQAVKDQAAHKSADQPLQQKQLGKVLQQALQQVPPKQRMVVIMKEYEGLKFREIAHILDLPEGTVKSRMYTGLSKLRDIFDQWNINKEALYYD